MSEQQLAYQNLRHIEPWVCVDIEINPETRKFLNASVLYKFKDEQLVNLNISDEKAFLKKLSSLLTDDVVLIGHNLRRHDLKWMAEKDAVIGQHDCCIDTLELFPVVYPTARSYSLEKAYKKPVDDPLIGTKRVNHPALDCRETCKLLESIVERFSKIDEIDEIKSKTYRLLLGYDSPFGKGNRRLIGSYKEGLSPRNAFQHALKDNLCLTAIDKLDEGSIDEDTSLSLAYLLSLISANADTPPLPPRPWLRYNFPKVVELIKALRGTDCGKCPYCQDQFDLLSQMGKLFYFSGEPQWRNAGQRDITEAVMQGRNIVGLLPTSGGKSLTFQLPALIRANASGSLTVVISPLRSLMDDQVSQLQNIHERDDVCQISGKLNSGERTHNLRMVRAEKLESSKLGRSNPAHIVYMAPEQLRSVSIRRSLAARGIDLLVIDEAHCMAKWGKDFRVDYRFIPKLIADLCKKEGMKIPQILCLTATARSEVLEEISECFRNWMGTELEVLDRGQSRSNLHFKCHRFEEDSNEQKYEFLKKKVEEAYHRNEPVLVFCSTKKRTEDIVNRLHNDGFAAVDYYHGGRDTPDRESVQNRFIDDQLLVVVATNAFGMGVDKKNIRYVIHYDVPGSLESFIQEAGRAGRDGKDSYCILLFDPIDLDVQLDIRRQNNLRRQDLYRIVTTLRIRYKLAKKRGEEFPEIIISARDLVKSKIDFKLLAEIVNDAESDEIESIYSHYDEEEKKMYINVTTALGILEEGQHLNRYENIFKFIPVSPQVKSWDKLRTLIVEKIPYELRIFAFRIAEYLFDKFTGSDKDVSVDLEVLSDECNIERKDTLDVLHELQKKRIVDLREIWEVTWEKDVTESSKKALSKRLALIGFLLTSMEDSESEMSFMSSEEIQLFDLNNIRIESLKKFGKLSGYSSNLELSKDLRQLSDWGLFNIVKRQKGQMFIQWIGNLQDAKKEFQHLSEICESILHYLDSIQDTKGRVSNRFKHLDYKKWRSDKVELFAQGSSDSNEIASEYDCKQALHFMHSREIIEVFNGFSISQFLMKIEPIENRIMDDAMPAYRDYEKYTKTTIAQIKAMERYAELLYSDQKKSEAFSNDYFKDDWEAFTEKYFTKAERKELHIPIRKVQLDKLLKTLTKEQESAVTAKERKNYLVIAGPGSGKTHVLIMRVIYLVKVKQIPSRCITILAYNRHASREIQRRLRIHLPKDRIGVHTFHGLALRLIGRDRLHELQSEKKGAQGNIIDKDLDVFEELLKECEITLKSEQGDDEYTQKKWLDRLNGMEYLLVDEFQDIGEQEYRIVKILSRMDLKKSGQVFVMAVGDDDQNIYETLKDSSVRWIRQFEEDFETGEVIFLPDNFRSVNSIIQVSSNFIRKNEGRIKPENWTQKVANSKKEWATTQEKLDPYNTRIIRLKVNNLAEVRYAISDEIQSIRSIFKDIMPKDICIAHHSNSEAYLTKHFLDKFNVKSILSGEHQFAKRFGLGIVEIIQELCQQDIDNSKISYQQLANLIDTIYKEKEIDPSWREFWHLFFDEDQLDLSPASQITVREMLWRINEQLLDRSGRVMSDDKITCSTLHGTKGLEFHTVFLFPPTFNLDKVAELRRLYFVGLSRAKVKAYLIDYPGCNKIFWDEMEGASKDLIMVKDFDSKENFPSKEEIELSQHFKHFDTRDKGLGTGMWFTFRLDNHVMCRIPRNQILSWHPGWHPETKAPLLDLRHNGRLVGKLSKAAAANLYREIDGDWNRIIKIEAAQICQTETPENAKVNQFGGSNYHYYIVPRIFYRSLKQD